MKGIARLLKALPFVDGWVAVTSTLLVFVVVYLNDGRVLDERALVSNHVGFFYAGIVAVNVLIAGAFDLYVVLHASHEAMRALRASARYEDWERRLERMPSARTLMQQTSQV